MSNVDPKHRAFCDRLTRIEADRRDLDVEMKSAKLSKAVIKGIKLAMRRSFLTPGQLQARLEEQAAAEHVADELTLSGAPLFAAAAA